MESQTNRKSLSHLMKNDALHAKLCAVALATPTQGRDVIDNTLFLCPECAHIEPDRPPASSARFAAHRRRSSSRCRDGDSQAQGLAGG